jgi:hypothetical protein
MKKGRSSEAVLCHPEVTRDLNIVSKRSLVPLDDKRGGWIIG